MSSTIRLADSSSLQFRSLVVESEIEGWRMVRRLQEEWTSGANRFDQPGEALFTSHISDELVGICGLNIDPFANDNSVGRVRRLYVHPRFRRQGVGSDLVRQVIEISKRQFKSLHVNSESEVGAKFYERMGFIRAKGVDRLTHRLVLPPHR